jgi:hypothetical protein
MASLAVPNRNKVLKGKFEQEVLKLLLLKKTLTPSWAHELTKSRRKA